MIFLLLLALPSLIPPTIQNQGVCPKVHSASIVKPSDTFRPIFVVPKPQDDFDDLSFYPSQSNLDEYGFYGNGTYMRKVEYRMDKNCDAFPAIQFDNKDTVGEIHLLDAITYKIKCQSNQWSNAVVMRPVDTKLILILGCHPRTRNGVQEYSQSAWICLHSQEFDERLTNGSLQLVKERALQLLDYAKLTNLSENLQIVSQKKTSRFPQCPVNLCELQRQNKKKEIRSFAIKVVWIVIAVIFCGVLFLICK